MSTLRFYVMEATTAARFVEATQGAACRLEPRQIQGGDHSGAWALPERVGVDEAFAEQWAALSLLHVAALEIAEAWPTTTESAEV